MCGIAGYLLDDVAVRSTASLLDMCQLMSHRGPDDEGFAFINRHTGNILTGIRGEFVKLHPQKRVINRAESVAHDLALGHRRFSIIDLSVAAHQPFLSNDGRIVITFNGEIYNFESIRAELVSLGHTFHTSSDTEVLLNAYIQWGEGAFIRFRGFWAIALYDLGRQSVLLCRDPLGKAPLYFAPMANGIAWASEIKALRPVATRDAMHPREQAIYDFVTYGYRDVDNRTCYSGVRTLPAGTYAWLNGRTYLKTQRYWQIPGTRMSERDITPEEAIGTFRDKFLASVERRLRADVPVAFELSGGMDSSSIVGAAVHLGRRVSTYTVKFDEAHSDEEPIARHLYRKYPNHIDYHVIRPGQTDFWEAADSYISLLDEPFHLPNMYTHFKIWRNMTSSGSRVSLNGAGGDELLAGYRNDFAAPLIHYLVRQGRVVAALRELLSTRERSAPMTMATHYYRALKQRYNWFHDGGILTTNILSKPRGPHTDIEHKLIDLMGNWRMNYWLRSGHQSWMGVPLEVRAPFLDMDLCDYVFTLPVTYLIRNGWHKWILRKAMEDILPPEITWRTKKMGFPFPIREWLMTNKERYFSIANNADCPYINSKALRENYDRMARIDPNYLWRTMSVTLWWIRSVRGERLAI